jgi:ERCC4-related helicase
LFSFIAGMQQFICHLNSYLDVIEKNPDVLKIIDILENMYKSHGENSRFFIFVKTRATAKAFAERLRDLKHLNCQYFTGSQVAAEYGGFLYYYLHTILFYLR